MYLTLRFIYALTHTQSSSESQPAFYHNYEYVRGQRLGVIRLNPMVAERLSRDDLKVTLHPRHLPMLTKPRPWLEPDEGGYMYNKGMFPRYLCVFNFQFCNDQVR